MRMLGDVSYKLFCSPCINYGVCTDTWQNYRLKRNLPKFSDLANETEGRKRGKRESSQNQEVAHESTAFDWTHMGTKGMMGLGAINFE